MKELRFSAAFLREQAAGGRLQVALVGFLNISFCPAFACFLRLHPYLSASLTHTYVCRFASSGFTLIGLLR